MLTRLLIQNYALIDNLEMDFGKGLNIITGETGAGKSIILDALSLALGQRAETGVLGSKDKKCVVEAEFLVKPYGLQSFFKEHDLDADDHCLVRREISPQGRSRAFINDTPVNITVLKDLSAQLIDVHSQHQTVEFTHPVNQLDVLDQVAGNTTLRSEYTSVYEQWKEAGTRLQELLDTEAQIKRDHDYYLFLRNELADAELKENENEGMEEEIDRLQHAETLKVHLFEASQILEGEQGAVHALKEALQLLEKAGKHNAVANGLKERLQSVLIELKDIAAETEGEAERSVSDPQRLQNLEERLDLINGFLVKHRVQSVNELLTLQEDFDQKVQSAESLDEDIDRLRTQLDSLRKDVEKKAKALHDSREKAGTELAKGVKHILEDLKMVGAELKIECKLVDEPMSTGMDKIQFLFQANKGSGLKEIQKVASGGEFSRLMLAIKSVTGKKNQLPTVIFDEIDTGVSGDVAGKMGHVMKELGQTMQVFAITHLPQVAVCGHAHYKVVKEDKKDRTVSSMVLLQDAEREEEIAKMLSGEKITQEALANARALMSLNTGKKKTPN